MHHINNLQDNSKIFKICKAKIIAARKKNKVSNIEKTVTFVTQKVKKPQAFVVDAAKCVFSHTGVWSECGYTVLLTYIFYYW